MSSWTIAASARPCVVEGVVRTAVFVSVLVVVVGGEKRDFRFLLFTHRSSSKGPVSSGRSGRETKCEGNILKKLCFFKDLRPIMKSQEDEGLIRTENRMILGVFLGV